MEFLAKGSYCISSAQYKPKLPHNYQVSLSTCRLSSRDGWYFLFFFKQKMLVNLLHGKKWEYIFPALLYNFSIRWVPWCRKSELIQVREIHSLWLKAVSRCFRIFSQSSNRVAVFNKDIWYENQSQQLHWIHFSWPLMVVEYFKRCHLIGQEMFQSFHFKWSTLSSYHGKQLLISDASFRVFSFMGIEWYKEEDTQVY